MDHVVTVEMIMWTFFPILGALAVLGVVVWIVSLFADAFKH